MKDLFATLLALPEPDFDNFDAVDYAGLTASEASIETLVQIIQDTGWAAELDEETADAVIVHAYRALGALGEIRFFDLFISMLRSAVIFGDDLYCEDFIELMTGIGNDTVPGLLAVLHDQDEPEDLRTSVIMTLDALAADDAVRETILGSYAHYLAAGHPTRDANAFLAASLSEHRAVDHFPLVRELYERNLINVSITGDIEQAEVQFGLRESRESKAPNFHSLEDKLRFKFRKEQLGPLPASDDPLEIISYFLELHATDSGMASVSQIDGFLLACLAAPRLIPPSRYTPFVWNKDGDPDQSPAWESPADAQLFHQCLMFLHNKAVVDLEDREFSPVFMVEEFEDGSRHNYQDWALGALVGTTLWEIGGTSPQALTQELVGELLGIAALEPDAIPPGEPIGKSGAARAFELFLQAYTEHRQPPEPRPNKPDAKLFYSDRHPYERESPKIGRNDPCPCGSGKKSKKCCMG